jgi:hypothetical protein
MGMKAGRTTSKLILYNLKNKRYRISADNEYDYKA